MLSATAAGGQSGQLISLQGSALFVGLSGDAYEGVNSGIGAEGQVRYNFPGLWSLGVGLQYSHHSFAPSYGLEPLSLFGVFVEPRRVIPMGKSLAPYVSGRLAFLRQSTDNGAEKVSASGLQLNAGGGLLVRLGPSTNLDAGLTVGSVRFGTYSTGNEAGSGTNWVWRLGLSHGIGR